jgi:hypothetical protein
MDAKIWADPKTRLPVRVEENSGAGSDPKISLVMTDFQINPDLDKSLFSLDVPPGYAVPQTVQVDVSRSPWAHLADSLKMAAQYNDGFFPATLRGEQGVDGMMLRAPKTLAEKHRKDSHQQVMELAIDFAAKVAAGIGVLYALPSDGCHYAGKGVKLGTPNRPIFWIQQKKGGRCAVIYADLSVKEVPSAEAPKLPEPKTGAKP